MTVMIGVGCVCVKRWEGGGWGSNVFKWSREGEKVFLQGLYCHSAGDMCVHGVVCLIILFFQGFTLGGGSGWSICVHL